MGIKIFEAPILALIPARGGSKGVPNKNLHLICGKPLIEYTVIAAKGVSEIDAVYVSSDDSRILEVALKIGAIPLRRPFEFATDSASPVTVVNHFIQTLPKHIQEIDPYILYLQPTSPLRNAEHIKDAIKMMVSKNAESLVSVVEAKTNPYKSFKLDSNGNMVSLFDERLSNSRRQDLPKCFYPNGAMYCFRLSAFVSRGGFPSNGSQPFFMSLEESLDIDSYEDINEVEKILRNQNG